MSHANLERIEEARECLDKLRRAAQHLPDSLGNPAQKCMEASQWVEKRAKDIETMKKLLQAIFFSTSVLDEDIHVNVCMTPELILEAKPSVYQTQKKEKV